MTEVDALMRNIDLRDVGKPLPERFVLGKDAILGQALGLRIVGLDGLSPEVSPIIPLGGGIN